MTPSAAPAAFGPTVGTAPVAGVQGLRIWTLGAAAVLVLLTLPAVKVSVGVDIRLGQIALVGVFALLLLRDLQSQQVPWGPLLAITAAGVLLSGLSVLSNYPKVKELTFLVKYLVLFPAAFYTGMRLAALLDRGRLAALLEITLLFGCLLAVLLEFHPVAALVHERPEHLSVGLKGSFWEQGMLAFFVGLFVLGALALRVEGRRWPARRWPLVVLYGFALGCALASYNKTIWVALIGACLASAVLYRGNPRFSGVARKWALRLALFAVVLIVALAAYNAWLPAGEKLVTAQALEHKWEVERGAALRIAWDLILDAPWLGHGFGFVEAYFGDHPSDITGLGSGVAQLFNAYLDLWLSAGVPGLVYILGLLIAAVSPRRLFPVLVVVYLFIFANVNPVAQHEYYYLFLGMAYAIARTARRREAYPAPAPGPTYSAAYTE